MSRLQETVRRQTDGNYVRSIGEVPVGEAGIVSFPDGRLTGPGGSCWEVSGPGGPARGRSEQR